MAAVTDGEIGLERQGHSERGQGQDLNPAGLSPPATPTSLRPGRGVCAGKSPLPAMDGHDTPGQMHCCGRPGTEGPNGATSLALADEAGVGLMLRMRAGAAGRHVDLGPGS